MATPGVNNEQIANDLKTAFEAMKTIFNVGSSSINVKNARSGGEAAAFSSSNRSDTPFCISVCSMNDLVDSIKSMKDSLNKLQLSLVTLEYCLITLTVILCFAVAITALGLIWYIAKTFLEDYHNKNNKSILNLKRRKKTNGPIETVASFSSNDKNHRSDSDNDRQQQAGEG